MPIIGLHHIGIYTADRECSRRFYEDMLGFVSTWSGEVSLPAGVYKAATLQQGTCIIELVQPPDITSVPSVHGPVQHLALEVQNLKDLAAQLEEKGVVFETRKITAMPDFSLCGVWHIFLIGPSGERIELVENMLHADA